MKTAVAKSSFKRIYFGGENLTLISSNFDLYVDGVIVSLGNRSANEYFHDWHMPTPMLTSSPSSGTVTLPIRMARHIYSASIAEDDAGARYNTYAEDLSGIRTLTLTVNLTHPTLGNFEGSVTMYYAPALWNPNLPIERLRATLRSIGNDYTTIFTNAAINGYSPNRPLTTPPYSAGACLGYSPDYCPAIVDYLYGAAITLDEGMAAFGYRVDYYFVPDQVISVTIDGVVHSTPNGTYTKILGVGSYAISASFKDSLGASHPLPSKAIAVYPAPINVTINTLTYSSMSRNATINITTIDGSRSYDVEVVYTYTYIKQGDQFATGGTTRTTYSNRTFAVGTSSYIFAAANPNTPTFDTKTGVTVNLSRGGNLIASKSVMF